MTAQVWLSNESTSAAKAIGLASAAGVVLADARPSCDTSLAPQHFTAVAGAATVTTAHVWWCPAVSEITPLRPLGDVGVATENDVVPLPISPSLLAPRHSTVALVVRAQVCPAPSAR